METTIDSNGRVTIPLDVQLKLGLKPGMRLQAEAANGSVVLTPASGSPSEAPPDTKEGDLVWEGNMLVIRGGPPLTVEDINALIRRLDEERVDKFWNPEG